MKYLVISKEWLENESKDVDTSTSEWDYAWAACARNILKTGNPLQPIIEDAFEAGREYEDVYGFAEDEVKFLNNKKQYINNFTLPLAK